MNKIKKIAAILMIIALNIVPINQAMALGLDSETVADGVEAALDAIGMTREDIVESINDGGLGTSSTSLMDGFLDDNFEDLSTDAIGWSVESGLEAVDPGTKYVMEEIFKMSPDRMGSTTSQVNAHEKKGIAPEVELMFSPENPKVGEEIKVSAFPINFNDDGDEFYFTWFLKHNDGSGSGSDEAGRMMKNGNTDWDENGHMNIEDYKIEAMRIIAAGNYDHRKANYGGSSDSDNDGMKSLDGDIQDGENNCKGGDDEDCTEASFGGLNIKKPTDGFRCYVKDFEGGGIHEIIIGTVSEITEATCLGEDCSINPDSLCIHNFAHAPGQITGDGKFTDKEEEFWGTNPNDPDTNDDGVNDEASVAGVGMNKLSWKFYPGDEVGVIVEGVGMKQTKHDDASGMVMYAMPRNNFDVNGTGCKITHKEDYWKKVAGVNIPISSANFDITQCLEYNFVNPMDGNQPGMLDVNLSHTPDKPKNSTTSEHGEHLTVTAMINNPEIDEDQIYYRWTVEHSDSFRRKVEDWEEISNSPSFRDVTGVQYLEGLGLDTLEMDLNVDNLKSYMRVSVEVEEYYDENVSRGGIAEEIITINLDEGNNIQFYSNTSGGEICEGGEICQALNNQVIEATVEGDYRNYLWTINGKEADDKFNDGILKQNNAVRFPIQGKPGDIYTVNVVANDTATVDADGDKNNGNKLEASRTLMIIEPFIKLIPRNGARPKLLGKYIGLDGEEIEDESKTSFEAEFGPDDIEQVIEIEAQFVPSWLPSDLKIDWVIDGNAVEDFHEPLLRIDTKDYPDGSKFNITASSVYVQDIQTRKDLRDKWNISQFKTGDRALVGGVGVSKIINPELASARKAPIRVMASLISGLPSQIMFLFRIALTMTMIVVVSGLMMSFERRRI
ncbi:hypothetical protein ACFL08_04615 [Patescibacteria group bacterium]